MNDAEPNAWGEQLRDAILENSAIRDGLTDDEAQPLIDWGLARAVEVTQGLDLMDEMDAEARYEELYNALPKLLTRITWVALYRADKGADWTTRTLEQLNEFNRTLLGDYAPQISPTAINAYAALTDGMEAGALVVELMRRLSPPPPPVQIDPEGMMI